MFTNKFVSAATLCPVRHATNIKRRIEYRQERDDLLLKRIKEICLPEKFLQISFQSSANYPHWKTIISTEGWIRWSNTIKIPFSKHICFDNKTPMLCIQKSWLNISKHRTFFSVPTESRMDAYSFILSNYLFILSNVPRFSPTALRNRTHNRTEGWKVINEMLL